MEGCKMTCVFVVCLLLPLAYLATIHKIIVELKGRPGEGRDEDSAQRYLSRASPAYQEIFFLFFPSVHSEVDRFCHGENYKPCSDL